MKLNCSTNLFQLKIIVLLLCALSIHFFIKMYPATLDFSYWSRINLILTMESAHLSPLIGTPASSAFTVITANICDLPIEAIVQCPVLLLPLTLLMVVILRYFSLNNSYYLLIPALYLVPINYPQAYLFGCHEAGLVLFLSFVILSLLAMKRVQNPRTLFLPMVLILSVLNFLSYKLVFMIVVFMFSLTVITYFEKCRNGSGNSSARYFLLITVTGIILILAFNNVFYQEFIPFSRIALENIDFGISKTGIGLGDPNELFEYSYQIPQSLALISKIRSILIYAGLLLTGVYFIRKYVWKMPLSVEEQIYLAGLSASVGVLLVYNILGLFEITYLLIAAFFGY